MVVRPKPEDILPIPGRDLDLVTVPFGFQLDLGQFIGILPGTWIDIEIRQHLDRDERAV